MLPETIPLQVVYEDAEVLVIDKPAGLVVHPGAGNTRHTLQNALLGRDPGLAALPRAGIIHRLDKDTSGLLVIARTPRAHTALARQILARSVARDYLAVCVGVMTGGGTVDEPIGRHRSDRLRMAIRSDGRPARTHYRLMERFRGHTYLKVKLDTGRTHQIRVHLAHLKYPLVGDPVYGSRLARPRGAGDALIAALRGFKRQALHAAALAFDHPQSEERLKLLPACSRRCAPTSGGAAPGGARGTTMRRCHSGAAGGTSPHGCRCAAGAAARRSTVPGHRCAAPRAGRQNRTAAALPSITWSGVAEAPPPSDFAGLLEALRTDARGGAAPGGGARGNATMRRSVGV